MRRIFARKTVLDNKTNEKSITTDLNKLQQERELAKVELNLIKSRIKNVEIEFARTTANLEKTKSDFELVLTQQMLKRKETLQLEKEHKFILTELALHVKSKQKLVEKLPPKVPSDLYKLIKKAILEMREEQIDKENNVGEHPGTAIQERTYQKLQRRQSQNSEEQFLYF